MLTFEAYCCFVLLCTLFPVGYDSFVVVTNSLTTSQWSSRFKCESNRTDEQTKCQRNEPGKPDYCTQEKDVCLRSPADWMWKYIDELEPEYQVLVREKSIDERLANVIYAMITTRGFDMQLNKIKAKNQADQRDFERLLIGPQVNESLCGLHLQQMLHLLDEFGTRLNLKKQNGHETEALSEPLIRLARVLDSFGRYESGFLSGRFQSFGSYDQCINTQLLLNEQQVTSMRYCWAHLNLDANLSPQLRDRKRFAHEFGETAISVGVCLPESCHSKSLNKHKQSIQRLLDSQFKFPSSFYERETVNISSMDCVADSKSPMGVPTSGKILLGLLALWLSLVVYATQRENSASGVNLDQDPKQQTSNWLTCISYTNCWNDFVESDRSKPDKEGHLIDLDVLNPFKSIICLSFVLSHGMISSFYVSNTTLRDHKLVELDPLFSGITLGPMIVDSYFVLTGVLITYLALIRQQRQESGNRRTMTTSFGSNIKTFIGNCAKLIAHRYVRLFPLFYLAFAFKKSILMYLGSGPMWNYGLNVKNFGHCRHEGWLDPLVVTSYAHKHYVRRCLPQTYTITCELLFVVFIAPVVYLINKWPKLIITFCFVTSIWSNSAGLDAYSRINDKIRWDFGELRFHGILQLYGSSIGYIYGIPDYRLGSILCGIIAGYFIFRYQQNQSQVDGQNNHYAKWLTRPLTWLAISYIILISLVSSLKEQLRPIFGGGYHIIVGHYVFTLRLGWCMAMAMLIFKLVTSWNGSKRGEWTKAKMWRILAKLNYAIFLIHFDLLLMDWHIQTVETNVSKYNIFKTFVFCYVSSIVLAIFVHVIIESPITRLTRRYLFGSETKSAIPDAAIQMDSQIYESTTIRQPNKV